MQKKVLVIYYSQTGQLETILDNFTAPLLQAGFQLETVRVFPKKPYTFPWSAQSFFTEMPNSVQGIPTELEAFELKETAYDLIIFGWQPWFLSQSIPSNSILHTPAFKAIAKGTPLITITGCRNMWLNAQEKQKIVFKELGVNWVGNIVLMDRHQNYVSGVTILYWMLWGKKDRLWNIFPNPGVSDADVANAGQFATTIVPHLQSGDWDTLQQELVGQGAIDVKWDLMFIEPRANILFNMWAKLINNKKNKGPWLVLFRYYLLIALFIVAPIVVGIYGLLFKPFLSKSINKKKQYYLGLN
jgi:hypothetical protein